jgi:hypothetical protein
MRIGRIPLWALLLGVPLVLLAVNCGPANVDNNTDNNKIALVDDSHQAVDANVAQDVKSDVNLEDGASDAFHYGYRRYWGAYGYPLYRYSPYYSYYYPYMRNWLYTYPHGYVRRLFY